MSGFAFSHQFSQRWLNTPPPIKQTIIQELDDIVKLLQPETDLDSYRFTVPNLHDKVEQLMAIEAIRQEKIQAEERRREREEQERLERERLETQRIENERLEKERLEQERIENERLEKERADQERLENEHLEQLKKEQAEMQAQRLEQDRVEIEKLANERAIAKKSSKKKNDKNITATPVEKPVELVTSEIITPVATEKNNTLSTTPPATDESSIAVESHSADMVYAIASTSSEVEVIKPVTSSTPVDLEAIKRQIIEQLQAHIETYLKESIDFMKSDLSKWLSEEVDKQLEQHLSGRNE